MKYLNTYKLFESISKYPDGFGRYLDNDDIQDSLQYDIGDMVWVRDWSDVPCQVMDIKVGVDVSGSPHNEILVYFYYVRNSETEEIERFRSFKLSEIE